MSVRLDLHAGNLPSPVTLADGSVVYAGRIARTGEHEYSWGTERRGAPELARIVEQINEHAKTTPIPVTLLHADGLVSQGATAIKVGRVRSARLDDDGVHAIAEIEISEPVGVDAIRGGLRELSLGYTTRVDAGGWHRDTVVDHLALVPAARCGSTCSLRADCGATCACRSSRYALDKGKISMDELKKAIEDAAAQKARADKAEADLAAAVKRADGLEAERDAERARADQAEQSRKDAADSFETRVAARAELVSTAHRVLGAEADVSKETDRAIKERVVVKLDAKAADKLKGKSDVYVDVYFDRITEELADADASLAGARTAVVSGRADTMSEMPDEEAARRAMEERTMNKYKASKATKENK